ncbi:Pentatricopeptide repeat-containing protein [Platanthera zijinensis]|uniref:Pentatricopeptide repeat-containing protein n=1 Tax=Platanthera zijinensis TaxID=2320716 RepID=A0AAP0B7D3_9ASPA
MACQPMHLSFCSCCKAQEWKLEIQKSRALLLPQNALKTPSATPAIKSPLEASYLHNTLRSYHSMLQDYTTVGMRTCGEKRMRLGCMNYARKAFDEMHQRDMVSWATLADEVEGLRLLCAMQRERNLPNGFDLSAGLRICSNCSNLDFGRQIHGQAIKMQLLSDLYVGSGLVDLYVKCGDTEQAERVFLCLPQYNEVSLNALLNGYAINGDESKAIKLFKETEHSKRIDKFTLSIVLRCCAGLGDVRKGRELHSLMIKVGLKIDEVLASNLIDVYGKSGCPDDAFKVFCRIRYADVVIWTSMISCLEKQGLKDEAIELFRSMVRMGVKPNHFTLASVAAASSEIGDRRFSTSVHAYVIKTGFEMVIEVSNAVLDMYMRSVNAKDGFFFFNTMEYHDIISWNALLSAFHNCREGLRIFQMLMENQVPNMYSFISALRSCTTLMEASYGCQVHTQILKNNLEDDLFVGTALVDMYAGCGYLNRASRVLYRMKQRDVFSWTVIISGHVKEDQGEIAIKFYNHMLQEGIRPNEFTLASCLKACSNLASLDSGRQFHSTTIKTGLGDAFVTSSLVDFYAKCGCLSDGEMIFASFGQPDLVSWNTIICGYSQHGLAGKALNAFQQMLHDGWKPDEVTFIAVLSACSHTGLLEEGRHHFESMNRVYGITPTAEHYACMISLLGKVGKLDEVERFIVGMEMTPDALIWQTVLTACKIHKHVELGERAAENLFKLEPQTDSGYLLLSNMYADLGMWTDVARVRAKMSSHGVKKEPGCSWIHGNGKVNVFLSQDVSHPMFEELNSMLNDLTQEMMNSYYP